MKTGITLNLEGISPYPTVEERLTASGNESGAGRGKGLYSLFCRFIGLCLHDMNKFICLGFRSTIYDTSKSCDFHIFVLLIANLISRTRRH